MREEFWPWLTHGPIRSFLGLNLLLFLVGFLFLVLCMNSIVNSMNIYSYCSPVHYLWETGLLFVWHVHSCVIHPDIQPATLNQVSTCVCALRMCCDCLSGFFFLFPVLQRSRGRSQTVSVVAQSAEFVSGAAAATVGTDWIVRSRHGSSEAGNQAASAGWRKTKLRAAGSHRLGKEVSSF